jgi:hypothetical protein
MTWTLTDLYLAYRQAKATLFFERRGVGMIELARFERDLGRNLQRLLTKISSSNWFDEISIGTTYITRICLPPPLSRAAAVPVLESGLGGWR